MTSHRITCPSRNHFFRFSRVGLKTCEILALLACASGCLDRPVGKTQPETQNIFVKQTKSSRIDKIDVLFMIDNSVSMADKQKVLAAAVPQLLRRLTAPDCVDPKNSSNRELKSDPKAACTTPGYIEEFSPVNDIHIGVVTSSLGDFGGTSCDYAVDDKETNKGPAKDDKGWLLGALPRTGGTLGNPYLSWTETDAQDFGAQIVTKENAFRDFVTAAGETGCGFEMSLESWYRFLVDPEPPSSVDVVTSQDGKKVSTGRGPIDNDILTQRANFLRPDSLLAIVMLTDENDCSMRDNGLSLRLSGAKDITKLRKGSAACEVSPNDPCCYSCNDSPPSGCQADPNCSIESAVDNKANLRCFDQKRRFGYDFLFPTSRYVNALKLKTICPYQNFGDLDCECKGHEGKTCVPGKAFPNPLYQADATAVAAGIQPRDDANMVFLTGIVGVPWQDIATPNSLTNSNILEYLPSSKITWDRILPDAAGNPALDPLMRESISERTGIHPVTNEPIGLAAPGQTKVNTINFHEWKPDDELQFACVFDLTQPLSAEADTDNLPGDARDCTPCDDKSKGCVPPPRGCSCGNKEDAQGSPLCQDPQTGAYGTIQYSAKAYPGVRLLEVLKGHNETAKDNSIVASICPKNLKWEDRTQPGYGYNPAVSSLVERLKSHLTEPCLPRPLDAENDKLNCMVIEGVTSPEWAQCALKGREPVDDVVADIIRRQMQNDGLCDVPGSTTTCASIQFCGLPQLSDEMDPTILPKQRCQNEMGFETKSPFPGFCYIDQDQGIGNPALVATCPAANKRKLRIVGNGADKRAPAPGYTFYACAGTPHVELAP
jgi:hypothetical protein